MKRTVLVIAGAVIAALPVYTTITAQSKSTPPVSANEWPTYGHDSGGQRFSPLTQLTPANVDKLQVAWVYHMRPAPSESSASGAPPTQGRGGGRGGSNFSTSETTPIVVDGVMYISTPYGGRVVALDSTTGREIWQFAVPAGSPSTRGVEYWPGDRETPAQIVFGSDSGRLYSLNAKTGEPNPSFGDRGSVDLNTPEILRGLSGSDGLGSPPAMYRNLIITGGRTQENPPQGPAGDVRAWDVHSGKLVWTFHSIPGAGEKYNDTWSGDSWKNRSGVNVWGFITVDAARGIVRCAVR
jgi:quinoprotein glucose dehydrogenase